MDDDLQLLYVCCFLRKSGEGVIPGRVFDGNYDQLDGYLSCSLDW